jgi:transposase InsO family protein
VKYAFIKSHLTEFNVGRCCEVLQVSRSGYYAWRHRRPGPAAIRRKNLVEQIRVVHEQSGRVYGSPRVHQDLEQQGQAVCENTVARLMREQAIRAKSKRKFVPRTTDSVHGQPIAENVLDRQFDASAPDQKWVADITYIPTDEGWLYLAAVLDLFSRKIVGWSMADHMETQLVDDALVMALAGRHPQAGLLHHSDRGSQYASDVYTHRLAGNGIKLSMSRMGNCWDNAVMESFWATLKTELVHHERFATREQARAAIFEYIEMFYNRRRLHSSLGYQSPEAFEAKHA